MHIVSHRTCGSRPPCTRHPIHACALVRCVVVVSLHPSPFFLFVPLLFFQPFQMSSSEFHEKLKSKPLCDFRLGTVATSDHETTLTAYSHQPTTSNQQPTTKNRNTNNHQQPTTANNRQQPPTTNNNNQQPRTTTNDHRPPTANSQKPKANNNHEQGGRLLKAWGKTSAARLSATCILPRWSHRCHERQLKKITWDLVMPRAIVTCGSSGCFSLGVSAGAMSKRLAAFRKAAGFQEQRPTADQRGGEPTRLPWRGLQECCCALVGGVHEHEGHLPGGANVPLRRPAERDGGADWASTLNMTTANANHE